MNYDLPVCVDVCGAAYAIRYDFRAVLDICAALDDPELDQQEKALVALTIFYPDFSTMPPEHYPEALKKCYWFIDCGDVEHSGSTARLMDWEQDFRYIVAPINRVLGQEIRSVPYDPETNTGGLHWWTFIGAYYEIGDCLFAQIVRIRDLKARGKELDPYDREFYRRNRDLVDLKTSYTDQDDAVLSQWIR